MARIFPFRAYRYSPQAGELERLLTQPYDKITPEMQERYYAASPYNLVRLILGRPEPADDEAENVYTRGKRHMTQWIGRGVLVREAQPALYAYFQQFEVDGQTRLRKGLICLGAVEDYSEGTVFRHELTHSGPKRDRLELLRHTRSHFGQLFLLYDDPRMEVDGWLDRAAEGEVAAAVTDEYGARHLLWTIPDPEAIATFQRLLEPHRLLIADGHHRYETALTFRNENPRLPGADRVMMTLINMRSPGLVILPTHRVVANLPHFRLGEVLRRASDDFSVEPLSGAEALRARLAGAATARIAIGAVFQGDPAWYALEADRAGRLDAAVLHERLLERVLGLSPEAVRDQKHLRYVRGFEEAAAQIRQPAVQAVFFLNPARIEQLAEVAFAGGVMPQKSTDFFPKLLSGLTIYRLGQTLQ